MSIKIVYVQINKKITESFFNPVILIYTKLWMVPIKEKFKSLLQEVK